MLTKRSELRRMFIFNELINPPIALRHPDASSFGG
jgi:hypothetical protein